MSRGRRWRRLRLRHAAMLERSAARSVLQAKRQPGCSMSVPSAVQNEPMNA